MSARSRAPTRPRGEYVPPLRSVLRALVLAVEPNAHVDRAGAVGDLERDVGRRRRGVQHLADERDLVQLLAVDAERVLAVRLHGVRELRHRDGRQGLHRGAGLRAALAGRRVAVLRARREATAAVRHEAATATAIVDAIVTAVVHLMCVVLCGV